MESTAATPSLRTAAPGIGWPAIPEPFAATVLAVLAQLRDSERLPPEQLAAAQSAQAQRVLEHAIATVPFYQERLRDRGRASGDPDPARWRRLPVLTRGDLQRAGTALHSTALAPEHGPVHTLQTSGSTARPVSVLGTRVTQLFWSVFTLRDHLWHGRDFRKRLGAIRYFADGSARPPEGRTEAVWGPTSGAVFECGPALMLNIKAATHEQQAWLERYHPEYLLSYPSNLRALAHGLRESRRSVPGLEQIITMGELLTADARAVIEDVFQVPVKDMYTSQEVGYMALQCPEHPHYHVQAENVLLEILDDSGNPCAPGQVGRVVVTALHNFAMPLIRYALGDYAEVGEPCACGRGLPVLKRILGRQRNMLRTPDGRSLWPSFGQDAALEDLPPVVQFQLVQESLERVRARLVTARAFSAADEERLRAYLAEALGYPFEVVFEYLAEIPRSAGGKYEDVVSLVSDSGP